MKKFYKQAAVREQDGMFAVTLDGRPIRTPGGNAWSAPTKALAEAAAAEWQAQDAAVDPASMPLTGFVGTTLDRIAPRRADIVAEIAQYGETDLLCYRAESPADLVAEQGEKWDPLLAWAKQEIGAELQVASGIMPVSQPATGVAALQRVVDAIPSDFELCALRCAVPILGSLVIGLAFHKRQLDAAAAFAVSRLEEAYQIRKWGEDSEAMKRTEALRVELNDIERFILLVRTTA